MPREDWRDRIADIVDAIERITVYTSELTFEAFKADRKSRDAVVWNIAVIGEAARTIPSSVTEKFTDVPWPLMRAMRNVVVHEYFGIDVQIVWDTATLDLPPLIEKLQMTASALDLY